MTNQAQTNKYCNADYQRAVGDMVGREVHYCVSSLVMELALQDKHMEDLLPVIANYNGDYEEDPVEALEHWIISDWLADKLAERGEMVIKDFLGLTIWGRTCSGQSIMLDSVICDIFDATGRAWK